MYKSSHAKPLNPAFPSIRHRSAGYIVSGLTVAMVMASALFWVMHKLISIVPVQIVEPPHKWGLQIVTLKRTLTTPPKRIRKTEPPPVVDQPLPQSTHTWSSDNTVPSFVFSNPSDDQLLGGKPGGTIGITHREYMPLTEITPAYPERALVRGIEGSCVVVYDITKSGSVENARIDLSRCTSTLFHQSSLKAASKFKYAPRIVDGEHQAARNVTKLFRFAITE